MKSFLLLSGLAGVMATAAMGGSLSYHTDSSKMSCGTAAVCVTNGDSSAVKSGLAFEAQSEENTSGSTEIAVTGKDSGDDGGSNGRSDDGSATPEPTTFLSLGVGLGVVGLVRRRLAR